MPGYRILAVLAVWVILHLFVRCRERTDMKTPLSLVEIHLTSFFPTEKPVSIPTCILAPFLLPCPNYQSLPISNFSGLLQYLATTSQTCVPNFSPPDSASLRTSTWLPDLDCVDSSHLENDNSAQFKETQSWSPCDHPWAGSSLDRPWGSVAQCSGYACLSGQVSTPVDNLAGDPPNNSSCCKTGRCSSADLWDPLNWFRSGLSSWL